MFKPTHIIAALSSKGANDEAHRFAWANDGKHCRLIGRAYEAQVGNERGMRQAVQNAFGEQGYVWEDEVEPICNGCVGCWQCD